MVDISRFTEVKNITNGYLKDTTYFELYKAALDAPEGIVLDIGPAQGGSTISFALAAQENRRLSKIYSIDKYCESAALQYNSVEKNIQNLFQNLEKFRLGNNVVALAAGRDDVTLIREQLPVSVLFIDADGAIDRDFNLYYNKLCENGVIIIDDCEEIINLHASKVYLKIQTEQQLERVLKGKGYSTLDEYTPLGKQYSTYQFVYYFEKNNFIKIDKILDGTVFAYKPEHAPGFTNETLMELRDLRTEIAHKYDTIHSSLRSCYDRLNSYLPKLAHILNMKNVLVFENFYYEVKDRMQTTRVYEWHAREEEYIQNDLPLLSVTFDSIKEFVPILEQGQSLALTSDSIQDSRLRTYIDSIGVRVFQAFPIIIEGTFWGFVIFYKTITDQSIYFDRNEEFTNLFSHMIEEIKMITQQVENIITIKE